MDDMTRLGELRHEQCRYGTLTPAWRYISDRLDWCPVLMPICNLPPPDPAPPWVSRCWSGAVEYDRDCGVCKVFTPVIIADPPPSNEFPPADRRGGPEML